jgi:ATP-dependent Clp protease ATP-binding subunit ClpC
LIVTLTQLTGLPASILDDREGLDLQSLRDFFHGRVLGQSEATTCLVERVAMIKAGLTDPSRPQGVFLFVGPTGTGKTEIAKTLAEFLFGSPNRMLRIDMSELQTPESLDRILGEQKEMPENMALVNQIRNQPFSVILLDEFEKAHPNVWDLFLQVFDDGRLTDRRGNTADFRHSIIILTSNLGANIPHGASIGFTHDGSGFTAGSVQREVSKVFRKEFLNRLDRIVVFRPLGSGVMKEILHKELNLILSRRGLRTRNWAVVWDDSAIDFLLNKGFTLELGARPLKRAIERYLLSPLAMTIVNHQFPEGDQFLIVSSDGQRIVVEFIDPDAPDPEISTDQAKVSDALQTDKQELRLNDLILDACGTAPEVAFLQQRYDTLQACVTGDVWQSKKATALSSTSSPGFWDSAERFAILGEAEYMDRIEAGLDTGGALLRRLIGSQSAPRQKFPRDLVKRLAQQIYLVGSAYDVLVSGLPRDAFLQVEGSRDAGEHWHVTNTFASQIGDMYRKWAALRRMRVEVLQETGADGSEPYLLLLSVIGFAAFNILAPEAGLHVLEIPGKEKRDFNRCQVRVRIAPQPEEPAGHALADWRAQARRVFAETDDIRWQIVRRYRKQPSPLIRDSVRKWRTGNWQRVLDGNFDLIPVQQQEYR